MHRLGVAGAVDRVAPERVRALGDGHGRNVGEERACRRVEAVERRAGLARAQRDDRRGHVPAVRPVGDGRGGRDRGGGRGRVERVGGGRGRGARGRGVAVSIDGDRSERVRGRGSESRRIEGRSGVRGDKRAVESTNDLVVVDARTGIGASGPGQPDARSPGRGCDETGRRGRRRCVDRRANELDGRGRSGMRPGQVYGGGSALAGKRRGHPSGDGQTRNAPPRGSPVHALPCKERVPDGRRIGPRGVQAEPVACDGERRGRARVIRWIGDLRRDTPDPTRPAGHVCTVRLDVAEPYRRARSVQALRSRTGIESRGGHPCHTRVRRRREEREPSSGLPYGIDVLRRRCGEASDAGNGGHSRGSAGPGNAPVRAPAHIQQTGARVPEHAVDAKSGPIRDGGQLIRAGIRRASCALNVGGARPRSGPAGRIAAYSHAVGTGFHPRDEDGVARCRDAGRKPARADQVGRRTPRPTAVRASAVPDPSRIAVDHVDDPVGLDHLAVGRTVELVARRDRGSRSPVGEYWRDRRQQENGAQQGHHSESAATCPTHDVPQSRSTSDHRDPVDDASTCMTVRRTQTRDRVGPLWPPSEPTAANLTWPIPSPRRKSLYLPPPSRRGTRRAACGGGSFIIHARARIRHHSRVPIRIVLKPLSRRNVLSRSMDHHYRCDCNLTTWTRLLPLSVTRTSPSLSSTSLGKLN